jgi:hypothetical protein
MFVHFRSDFVFIAYSQRWYIMLHCTPDYRYFAYYLAFRPPLTHSCNHDGLITSPTNVWITISIYWLFSVVTPSFIYWKLKYTVSVRNLINRPHCKLQLCMMNNRECDVNQKNNVPSIDLMIRIIIDSEDTYVRYNTATTCMIDSCELLLVVRISRSLVVILKGW